MAFKELIEEAMNKGKDLKNDLLSELLRSKMLTDMVQNDKITKVLTHLFQTKENVSHLLRKNLQQVFKLIDVPSRNDLTRLEHKIDHLEKIIDRVGKKAITVKSLHKIQTAKTTTSSRKMPI